MIISVQNNNYKIIYQSPCIRHLQDELECVSWDFVLKHSVIEKKFYKKSSSRKWGKVPYGFFMVSKQNKITIYRKVKNAGYIYNTDSVHKVISFILILPEKPVFIPEQKKSDYIDTVQFHIGMLRDVYVSLRKRFESLPQGSDL